jgi:hypothetical protein
MGFDYGEHRATETPALVSVCGSGGGLQMTADGHYLCRRNASSTPAIETFCAI